MKLVYGDHVVENASVVIEPSRLYPHDEPGRIIKLIELTVPADASNGGYAVRQLLGQDPDICAKSVVTLEVALTQQQISRLENITEDELRDIRNGVNPAMIYGVRVYDSEPMNVEDFIVGKLREESGKSQKCKLPVWYRPRESRIIPGRPEIILWRIDSEHYGETFVRGGGSWDWFAEESPVSDDMVEITQQEAELLLKKEREPAVFPKWLVPLYDQRNTIGNKIICIRRDSETGSEMFCEGGRSYLSNMWDGHSVNLTEITEQEAQAIIAHSVNPTGEYPGCVQWFQHSLPSVIVRRDSRDQCTYFDERLVTPGILWDYHMSQWVKSGVWKEITQQEAELRIEQNRKPAELKAQEPKPGMCKREQFAGGGTPSPRSCDVCLEGPCPRVIPVQTEEADSPAMQALRKLAQQCGIDPAGLNAEQMADRVIEHNRNRPYSLSCGSETCSMNGKQSDPGSAFLQVPCRGCGDKTQAQAQMIAANKRVVAELTKMHNAIARSFQQLPADRDAVIRPIDLAAAKDDQMLEFHVEQVKVPRAGIDHVSLIESGGRWNEVCEDNVWNAATWAARRHNFKIRCLPQHLPPVRNAAEPKPLPRNIPNLAFVGIDWGNRSDIGAKQQVSLLPLSLGEVPLQLELRSSFDSEGIWLYAVDDDLRLAFVRAQDVGTKSYTFTIEVPCIQLCGYPRVKWPVGYRHAVMPKDYGKEVMYFNDTRTGWGRGILRGMEKNNTEADRMIIDLPAKDEMFDPERITVGARLVFIIDQPTEGF